MKRLTAALAAAGLLASGLAVAQTAPKPLSSFRDCIQCGEMVVIPAGPFSMGETAEQARREPETPDIGASQGPVHRVDVASFAIAKYAVTREQFQQFVDDTGYRAPGCTLTFWNGQSTGRKFVPAASWDDPGFGQTDSDPVVCVAWDDATAYVNWLAAKTGKPYRLPTEAEMEYATRAGTAASRFWGDDAAFQCKYANGADLTAQRAFPGWTSQTDLGVGHVAACADGHVQTAPVGAFAANLWGLYDMLGNAAAWTADCWHPNYDGAPTRGGAWDEEMCEQHVIRGGGWFYQPGTPHSSYRQAMGLHERLDFVGIRVARSLP